MAQPDAGTLATFYGQLGTMLQAGLDLQRALAVLADGRDDPRVAAAAKSAGSLVANGATLSTAGQRVGMIRGLDLEIVTASEQSGSLSAGLKRLGVWYESRAARARLIKSRMVFPAAVFVLAVFLAPIPALFAGSISGFEYVVSVLVTLFQVALIAWLLWRLPGWLRARHRRGSNAFDRARLEVPWLGPLHQRRDVLQVVESFELLYSAGVAAHQAMRLAAAGASNGHVQSRFMHSLELLEQGAPLAEAFRAAGLLSASANQMLATGDASGRLTEMLRRFSTLERGALELVDQQIADWLPRLVYALVAGWMASHILGARFGSF